jgi:hypothetical protein
VTLAAAGGVGALVVLAAGVLLFRYLNREADAPPPPPPSAGAIAAAEGMKAPGTDALRRLGCDPAIALDLAQVMGQAALHAGEPRYMVTCDLPATASLSCDGAAAAYFGALSAVPGGNVSVRLSRAGASQPSCSRLYAPSGAPLD